jgi:putative ABC transport system permease protein
MAQRFLPISFRQIFKHKLNFLINTLGISIGLSVCLYILMYVSNEVNFDKQHLNSENIYRVHSIMPNSDGGQETWATSTFSYGPVLKDNCKEVTDYTRLYLFESDRTIFYKEKDVKLREEKVFVADANFFKFFDFPLAIGNPEEVLTQPNTVVLSERMAKKIFKSENPVGKIIEINNRSNSFKCKVTGIFENLPSNSHLQFDILFSLETIVEVRYKPYNGNINTDWGHHLSYTYVLLNKGTSIKKIVKEFDKQVTEISKRIGWIDNKWSIKLKALEDIHLSPSLPLEGEIKGSKLAVKGLLGIALIIMFIAWINYINLFTVKVLSRNIEMGIRRLLGVQNFDLFRLMLTESFIINLFSGVLTLIFVFLWDYLLKYLGVNFRFPIMDTPLFWQYFALALVVGTLILGIVPTFFIIQYNAKQLLTKKNGVDSSGISLRKVLVILQLTASVVMIITTIVVFKQISFMYQQDLGMKIEKLLVMHAPGSIEDRHNKIMSFNSTIRELPRVTNITLASDVPGKKNVTQYGFSKDDLSTSTAKLFDVVRVDYDFVRTFGFNLLAGRDFSKEFGKELEGIIINETALNSLGFKSPDDAINKLVNTDVGVRFKVIGVVKDYHYESPKQKYRPIVFHKRPLPYMGYNYICVNMNSAVAKHDLEFLKQRWERVFPSDPFDYFFLNKFYEKQYVSDIQLGKLLVLFTCLTIFVTCMGLFGLLLFMISGRVKEIGIRKVNGAKISEIMLLLNMDFIKMLAVAFVIACPLAYFMMNKWLEMFAQKTDLSWWIYFLAGILTSTIVLVTVSWQSWKASLRNPVDALRYE